MIGDKIASATIAGHLIECGTQVTGGISTEWLSIANPKAIEYPVVEMFPNGTFNIRGYALTINSVKEQLLYEIGDPNCYLSPM